MKNEYKIPFIIFLLGMVITIVGALFKIMHWPFANVILIVGMGLEAAGIISLIFKIAKK